MEHEGKVTTDHDTIRNWAEERQGVPASIDDTAPDDQAGLLRIHFPDKSPDTNEFTRLDWNEFFEKFDQENLAFLYQDETDSGGTSRFHKFIER